VPPSGAKIASESSGLKRFEEVVVGCSTLRFAEEG